MKINITNNNIEKVNSGTIQPQAVNSGIKDSNSTEQIPQANSQTIQNLSKKRSVVDAIIISQLAGSVIQEAIRISSRLKGIASEALTTGKLKENELVQTLAGIKSSLKEIQHGFAVPSSYRLPVNTEGVNVLLPQININEEIELLSKYTDDLSSGNVNLKKIDRINESLVNKSTIADNVIKQLADELAVHSRVLNISSGEKYPDLVKNVANEIIKFPQVALKSQWNINSEVVKNLL